MANNLVISYDLYKQGQNYEAVAAEIKSLGSWAKVNLSVWYVDSKYTSSEAAAKIWRVMDRNDKLFVTDATNNTAHWYNLDPAVTKHLQERWNLK